MKKMTFDVIQKTWNLLTNAKTRWTIDTVPALVTFRRTNFGHDPWWYDPDAPCYGSNRRDFGMALLPSRPLVALPKLRPYNVALFP